MKYGYQGLDSGSKVPYLLNGIRYDKLSTAVAAIRVQPDKYKKDFNTLVTFLSQGIDKKAPSLSVKVAYASQNRSTKQKKANATCGTIKGKFELKK